MGNKVKDKRNEIISEKAISKNEGKRDKMRKVNKILEVRKRKKDI